MIKIPTQGLTGEVLLREAVTEYRAIIDLVRGALVKYLYPAGPQDWISLEAIYADRVIVEKDGKKIQFPYTIDGNNQVTFGDPIEVKEEYVPIKEALKNLKNGESVFLEAQGDTSSGKWLIRVIKAGVSGNNNFYPDTTLREAVPLFNGARVFVKSDAEHIKGDGKAFNQLVGGLSDAIFVEGNTPDSGEIQAVLTLIEPAGDVAIKIREAFVRGLANLFGFSVDVSAPSSTVKVVIREAKKVRMATKFTKVNSVDLIVEPGAGGQLIRMVESINPEKEQDTMRTRMLEAVQKKDPAKFAGVDPATIADDVLEAAYREAIAAPAGGGTNNADVAEQIRMVEARANMRATIAACSLPQAAKDKLTAEFTARDRFVEADVAAAIATEREYLSRFTESGKPVLNFDEGARSEDTSVKLGNMLDAFFDPAHADHRNVRSFKECYITITGDKHVTGRMENCDRTRLAEALGGAFRESLDSASFSNVLGAAITRRMVAEYNSAVDYQAWRPLVSVVPVSDFRTQERTRFGGYGDLPIVAEKDPYAALASPTDEKATYAVGKRGGTEDVTLEMIKNDDVGAIQRIPQKLGRAAQRTLAKFVFDFYRNNAVIYDGLALFHATHGNLGSAALDAAGLAARRLAMLKQTEAGSGDRLGVGPKFLIVPPDLEETAVNLFNRSTNNDKTFIQSLTPTIIPVWYWTDVTDWVLSADPRDIPTIEIGFLDGREEPELFVQDTPNVGSLFANDTVTYKIRHIYGGAVADYRGLDKSVVAG